MLVAQSIPSSATPTLLLAQSPIERHWLAITNHGTANVFYSIDQVRNTSALLTPSGGVAPGILLPPGSTHFFSRNQAAQNSNTAPVYVVQQSGADQQVSVQYTP